MEKDSIDLWVDSSKKNNISLTRRKMFLLKAYNSVNKHPNSSEYPKKLSEIAYQYLILKDTVLYGKINGEARYLALRLKDTFALADTHWNDANLFKGLEIYDSAYYHYNTAYKYFESIEEDNYAAKMLFGMAFIKGRYKDYTGSESLIIKAISKYKNLKKYKSLYASYNHLALIQRDIEEYDMSLYYHDIAMQYLNKIKSRDNKRYLQASLNNIGLVYMDKGEYRIALDNFNKVLDDDSLRIRNIGQYARVLDNRAYCKFLNNDTLGIKGDFYESLKLREDLNNKNGIIICKLHLSEYYSFKGDTVQAIKYADDAKVMAKDVKNSRDYLASLAILSKLDYKDASEHLRNYISFNDSILDTERKALNKFARIAYETDEYIEENKHLSEQKKWLLVIAFGVLLTLSLIYYIIIQRARNKNLLLEAEQQKANEEVYQLTIKQQLELEEEKRKERNRISQDLHDAILGNLFGIRMRLDFLKLKMNETIVKEYNQLLDKLQNAENDIRTVSHELNSDETSSSSNFKALLNQLLEDKSRLGNFDYELVMDESIDWRHIDEVVKVNLYRILQETLQNIIKHAGGEHISVHLNLKDEDWLEMKVKDNGRGFNPLKAKYGIGIKNMKSRIKKLGGSITINSSINHGTDLKIKIPILNK